MKSGFSLAKNIVWLTQLAFSAVGPLVLCIWGSVWLSERFQIGTWMIIVGVLAGIGGAVSGFITSLKTMKLNADLEEKDKKTPVSFNDHK